MENYNTPKAAGKQTKKEVRTLLCIYSEDKIQRVTVKGVVGQSVTLPQKKICAPKGTDVKIPCGYKIWHNQKVQSKRWYRVGGSGVDLKKDREYQSRSVEECWSITYSHENICALRGSSVDLSCSYTYPAWHTVTTTLWYNTWQYWVEPTDLSLDEDYEGRVEFRGDKKSDCTLRIRDLRESDARNYKFRFLTNQKGGVYSGTSGVSLSITDLQVGVSNMREGQRITLTCNTSCSLSDNPTYIWYKNRQSVTNRQTNSNHLILNDVSTADAGSYSCAIKGLENLRSPSVYSPKNPTVSVSPSGEIVEGSSVTLTCSSDANPSVHTYTWYKKNGAETSLMRSGQNYSITNISSEDSGQYYCSTENTLGSNNSTLFTVDVLYPPKNTSVSVISSGSSVTLICISDANPAVHNYAWFKKTGDKSIPVGTEKNLTLTSGDDSLYYCMANNTVGSRTSAPIIQGTPPEVFVNHIYEINRKRKFSPHRETRAQDDDRQDDPVPLYANINSALAVTSDSTQGEDSDSQDYTNCIQLSQSDIPLYSTLQLPHGSRQQEGAPYATVNFIRTSAATRREDTAVIYSTVQNPTAGVEH
ncbi:sialoadhesin-like [Chanos chanos]|uniref:Sialoadhesin-like n=1 Tax=Chanos chanos TaxID=29144 RepID=A0A6J2W3E3_CHACN|nr:sialoadhesin-like [Chanos chanos]